MPYMIQTEFPQDEKIIYLNHAAVSPWPKRTANAVREFASENLRRGAADYPEWLKTEHELRQRLARLVHAESAADISLVKNTSEGLSLIAYGLDWQNGDNIVSTDQEFPSNRIVWESLRDKGVELRLAKLEGEEAPEQAMLRLADERTRLITVSSVQFGSGLAMDLQPLGDFCRANGIIFCVDAIQSLGAIRFDAQAIHADVVAADGHKWMLGPEGLAVFYTRPSLRERLGLNQYGWHMTRNAGDFDRTDWQPSNSGTRFEPGSPNMLGIHALNASLSLLEDIGMDKIEENVLENAALLIERIRQEPGLKLITPENRHAGIITFRRHGADHARLYRRLMANGVICAMRGGGIRFSTHFYNTPEKINRALDIVLMHR